MHRTRLHSSSLGRTVCRSAARPVAAALLGLALALPAGAAAADAPPRIVIDPTEIRATDDLSWSFVMRVVNTLGVGLYADSLLCLVSDTDPGTPPGGMARTLSLPVVAQAIGSMSAGDSIEFRQTFPAMCESGTIAFRLFGHQSDGKIVIAQSPTTTVLPGPVSEAHPSEFLTVAGKKVEVVLFRSEKEGPAPGLLLVHEEGSHARQLLATALPLAKRGYHVLLVSMPGCGQSEGSRDDAAARVAAAGAALDRLKREPGVNGAKLGVWGLSQGAETAAALAAKRTDLAALVAQSGRFTTPATPRKGQAATLVLHGATDPVVPADQARAFAAGLEKAGVTVETKIVPGFGHSLPVGIAQRTALPFLEARLLH